MLARMRSALSKLSLTGLTFDRQNLRRYEVLDQLRLTYMLFADCTSVKTCSLLSTFDRNPFRCKAVHWASACDQIHGCIRSSWGARPYRGPEITSRYFIGQNGAEQILVSAALLSGDMQFTYHNSSDTMDTDWLVSNIYSRSDVGCV